mgnify:CR=1 FL=1
MLRFSYTFSVSGPDVQIRDPQCQHLNMSGGVNGELLLRGGANMQRQLHDFLNEKRLRHVEPGFVMEIGPEPTHFKCIVYTVAIDGFYGSSIELVAASLCNAFDVLVSKGCRTVAVPALATGYGPLRMSEFAQALHKCLASQAWPFDEIRVVLRNEHDLNEFRDAYAAI